jgi:ArsR family transcriptional regulator, arsenate/arsenite/antimonite-responsive transcriptional repressor
MNEEQAVNSLSALAHGNRLRIFRLLVKRGPWGLPAGEIADRVGMSATNTSFHLKELDRAGLLRSTRYGRFVLYAIDVEGMRRLLTFLTEDCCEGRPELCGAVVADMSQLCSVTKGASK